MRRLNRMALDKTGFGEAYGHSDENAEKAVVRERSRNEVRTTKNRSRLGRFFFCSTSS